MKSESSPATLKDNKSFFIHISDYFSHSLIPYCSVWHLGIRCISKTHIPLGIWRHTAKEKTYFFFFFYYKTRDNLYLNKHVWIHISLDKMKLQHRYYFPLQKVLLYYLYYYLYLLYLLYFLYYVQVFDNLVFN